MYVVQYLARFGFGPTFLAGLGSRPKYLAGFGSGPAYLARFRHTRTKSVSDPSFTDWN